MRLKLILSCLEYIILLTSLGKHALPCLTTFGIVRVGIEVKHPSLKQILRQFTSLLDGHSSLRACTSESSIEVANSEGVYSLHHASFRLEVPLELVLLMVGTIHSKRRLLRRLLGVHFLLLLLFNAFDHMLRDSVELQPLSLLAEEVVSCSIPYLVLVLWHIFSILVADYLYLSRGAMALGR